MGIVEMVFLCLYMMSTGQGGQIDGTTYKRPDRIFYLMSAFYMIMVMDS